MSMVSDPLAPGNGVHTAEQALLDASHALTIDLDLKFVSKAILSADAAMFDARPSWVLRHDPAAKTLRTRLSRGRFDRGVTSATGG